MADEIVTVVIHGLPTERTKGVYTELERGVRTAVIRVINPSTVSVFMPTNLSDCEQLNDELWAEVRIFIPIGSTANVETLVAIEQAVVDVLLRFVKVRPSGRVTWKVLVNVVAVNTGCTVYEFEDVEFCR